ncbi:hypothetical protein chiPu_0033721, partial [Chiloscyllium punctatum]|nr:hypothetical protein [Chiloscyllium punctatum]
MTNASATPEGRGGAFRGGRSGPLHVAGGRKHGLGGIDLGDDVPAPAGVLLVERLLGLVGQRAERGDV